MTRVLPRLLVPLLLLSYGAAPHAVAAGRQNPHLQEGIQLLGQAEDEKALVQLRKALKRRKNSRSTRVQIHMYLGITYLNLLQQANAERHFRRGLRLDLELRLPAGVSPKISETVDRLRLEVRATPAPKPGSKLVRRRPRRGRTTRPRRQRITPTVQRRSDKRGGGLYWPALAALGVAAAVGGTGLVLGIVANNKDDEAHDLGTPTGPAVKSHDTARKMALTANILYGLAGAAAVASGALFYWGSRQGKPSRVSSVGVSPLEGGALVQIGGAF